MRNHLFWGGVENSARPVIFKLKTLFGPKVLFFLSKLKHLYSKIKCFFKGIKIGCNLILGSFCKTETRYREFSANDFRILQAYL